MINERMTELEIVVENLRIHQVELEIQNEELRRVQVELEASRAQYFDLYDLAPLGNITVNEKGTIIEANLTIAKILGVARSILVKSTFSGFIIPEDRDIYYHQVRKHFKLGGLQEYELRMVTSDGTTFWANLNATIVRNEDGTTVSKIVLSDVTERKQSENTLLESERKYRFLLENSSDIIWHLDSNFCFDYVSPSDFKIRGFTIEEVTGTSLWSILKTEDIERIKKINKERILNRTQSISSTITHELQFICKNGSYVVLETNVTPHLKNEEIVGYQGISRDITERRKTEDERVKTQKLESLGVLAGGIAHDFNNLLTGIIGNLSLVAFEDNRGEREKLIGDAMEATKRASGLTRKLLTFAKGGTPETKVCSVSEVISSSAEFALGHSSQTHCKFNIPTDLWWANMDAGQISQVVQNLVINARQAMPLGGNIEVRAENLELTANNHQDLPDGLYVQIFVKDTGIGIPKEYLEKIFEPYFSTKSGEEGGSGLGLAVVYTVIKNHKGKITVKSAQGKGTTFQILLPAVKQEIAEMEVEEKKAKPFRRLKILVMDDELMIRKLLESMLVRLGHKVELAEHGRETLTMYYSALQSGKLFDMVILDLTIPGGMGGAETLINLQKIDENVVAIVSSGYSENRPLGFHGSLPKPYTMVNLRTMIESIFQS